MKASWVYFRYVMLDEYEDVIAAREHARILDEIKGLPAPYRNSDPAPKDINNLVMELRHQDIRGEKCSVFAVGYNIGTRVERRYNRRADRVDLREAPADDMRLTSVIMVPRLRMVAARDGSGERLSALSGVGRLRAIIEHNTGCSFKFERTASHDDVIRAMANLELEEFTFEVRPFNPHPAIPGQKLHDLMKPNGIGKLSAKAIPEAGNSMNSGPEGLIPEATGMSARGYGQFGLKGRTETGAEIKFQKPKFVGDKAKDVDQQEKPTALRVTVPIDDDDMNEYEYVVQTMRELFDA